MMDELNERLKFTAGKRLRILLVGAEPDLRGLIKEGTSDWPATSLLGGVDWVAYSDKAWAEAGSKHQGFTICLVPHAPVMPTEELYRHVLKMINGINQDGAIVVIALIKPEARRKAALDVLAILEREQPTVRRVLLIADGMRSSGLPDNHVHAKVPEVIVTMADFSGSGVHEAVNYHVPRGFDLPPNEARSITLWGELD